MQLSFIAAILAATAGTSASPTRDLSARTNIKYVKHDSLIPFLNTLPADKEQADIIRKFNPTLHVTHGCQVMTAVNDKGEISSGLQDSGSPNGGCRWTDRGQTYVRTANYKEIFAIMYAWYWPKDHPNAGNVAGGHRHDWESVVVWLSTNCTDDAKLLGASASGHGQYKKNTDPPKVGDSVEIEYFTNFPMNHELRFTTTAGWYFNLLEWHTMPAVTREALQNADFGAANVPFKDGNFESNLDKAVLDGY
ncbi:uncharacterized protein L3040_004526 [Drepanopeziza brunnea f. sp. 'multigermtubi']|nr:hypothetical protein L3040_004526 [Drepanopeziza brunnea f. sp. 'multigermtubi']